MSIGPSIVACQRRRLLSESGERERREAGEGEKEESSSSNLRVVLDDIVLV